MSCSKCAELEIVVDKIREAVIGNGRMISMVIDDIEQKRKLRGVKEQYDRLNQLLNFGKKFNEREQKHYDDIKAIVDRHNL